LSDGSISNSIFTHVSDIGAVRLPPCQSRSETRISTSSLKGTYLDFDEHVCRCKNASEYGWKADDQESTLPECSTTN